MLEIFLNLWYIKIFFWKICKKKTFIWKKIFFENSHLRYFIGKEVFPTGGLLVDTLTRRSISSRRNLTGKLSRKVKHFAAGGPDDQRWRWRWTKLHGMPTRTPRWDHWLDQKRRNYMANGHCYNYRGIGFPFVVVTIERSTAPAIRLKTHTELICGNGVLELLILKSFFFHIKKKRVILTHHVRSGSNNFRIRTRGGEDFIGNLLNENKSKEYSSRNRHGWHNLRLLRP